MVGRAKTCSSLSERVPVNLRADVAEADQDAHLIAHRRRSPKPHFSQSGADKLAMEFKDMVHLVIVLNTFELEVPYSTSRCSFKEHPGWSH